MKVSDALDAVLRDAVLRNDRALIDAYRAVYEGRPGGSIHDALRLGILVGLVQRYAL